MLRITLDTNCFFDYYERASPYLDRLIHHAEKGNIELAMTTRVRSDTRDRWHNEGESPIWTKIQSFPLIRTIGTPFQLDVSYLDSVDFTVSDDESKLIDDLHDVLKRAQTEDIYHIAGHIVGKRDMFVTSDRHFLNHSDELLRRFGVLVVGPEGAAQHIDKVFPP